MSKRQFKRKKLIRLPEVCDRVQLSKPTIYRKMANGTFPKAKQLGERAVAWVENDIDDFIENLEVA